MLRLLQMLLQQNMGEWKLVEGHVSRVQALQEQCVSLQTEAAREE